MNTRLRGTIDGRHGWVRMLLGWMLLAAALLTPLAVLLLTSQDNQAPAVAVQGQSQVTYESGGKRDPFRNPLEIKRVEAPKPEFDVAPPRNRRPPGPTGMLVGEVQLVGIVQAPGGRVAMIAGDGPVTYFLHEGDKLYDGYIRRINDEAVHFVREIKVSSRVVDQQEIAKKIYPTP